MKKITEKKTH